MQFLSAKEPIPLQVYGQNFNLTPIQLPDVDITQILVAEDELGRRVLEKDNNSKLNRLSFDAHNLPGFPEPLLPLRQIENQSRVLIIRGGGIGDVLMSVPAVRALKAQLPVTAHITLSTFQDNARLFANIPEIDSVVGQPMTLANFMEADYYTEFKDTDSQISSIHMIDFYLESLGFNSKEITDKSISLPLGNMLDRQIQELITDAGREFISTAYLNGLASDVIRDLPPAMLNVFIENLPDHLFVIPKSYTDRYKNEASCIKDSSNILYINTIGSLSAYLTAIHSCDSVITTDSSAYHIASAMDKPCLVIFGPIDAGLRTTYYPKAIALEPVYKGQKCNSPCGKSMFSEFAENRGTDEKRCPEATLRQSNFSPCIESFSENELIDAFKEMVKLQ